MASIQNNLFVDTASFIRNHTTLCVLTCGLAAVIYAVGHLAGRAVFWIGEYVGVTQEVDKVARQQLEAKASEEVVTLKTILETATSNIPSSIKGSFTSFCKELTLHILPLYTMNKQGLTHYKIHSPMHIIRAFFFVEVMLRYLVSTNRMTEENVDLARRAIGLYDTGGKETSLPERKQKSARELYTYLIRNNTIEEEAKKQSKVVISEEEGSFYSMEAMLVHSADCLESMRQKYNAFYNQTTRCDPKSLSFLKDSQDSNDLLFRTALIREAREFISMTESGQEWVHKENGSIETLLGIIHKQAKRFPILSSLLPRSSLHNLS